MRQVFLDKGIVVVREVCRPLLDDYSVLVAVHYSYVSSGTELATIAHANQSVLFSNVPQKVKKILSSISSHGIDGTAALIKSKLKGELQSLGYSCAGRVIAVGKKVTSLRYGDYVACAGAGFAHHADIVCVPENLVVRVSKKEHLKLASLTTIGAIALQGIRRAQVQLGDYVCVLGLGLLGQITVQLAKNCGCIVIGVDLLAERLALAKECGADMVINATHENCSDEIASFTGRCGVDTTIITAASQSDTLVQQAMEITRKKGRVVLVGDVGLKLERNPWYEKEIDFLISCSYGPGRYDTAYEQNGQDYPYAFVRWTENRNMQAFISLIEHERIKLGGLISAEVTLDDVATGYDLLKNKKGLGVIIRYEPEKIDEEISISSEGDQGYKKDGIITFVPAVKDVMSVGIIGAGGFAKVKLLPIISRLQSIKINAVVDADIRKSLSTSRLYGAAKALVDDTDLFKEDLVDVVVIASPHKFHCEQALKALYNGKAVFVEKPMVTDFDQLAHVKEFFKHYPQAPFCVDYNRSFAPFIKKIKRVIKKRNTPLMVQYRMNAGFMPKDHWVQTEIGAGRVIGEACHIFDLFCFLTDSKPLSISVESLHSTRNTLLFPTDNFCVQIQFEDGSTCSLLYTSLGHAQLGKERMEIFFDSKAIVMDDYVRLTGYGLSSSFNETMKIADKGHEALLTAFFKQVRQKTFVPPISIDRLISVAELTLMIDQLACEGGGNRELTQ